MALRREPARTNGCRVSKTSAAGRTELTLTATEFRLLLELAQLPVTPGTGYSFATYPAGGCEAAFTVSP